MGYTHYFTQKGETPNEQDWQGIKLRARSILQRHIDIVCREYDSMSEFPLIDDDCIMFNGMADEGHEAFFIAKDQKGFSFCKTAQKPYDEVVVKILKMVQSECPGWLELSSDGDINDGPKVFGSSEQL